MRTDRRVLGSLVGIVVAAAGLMACAGVKPPEPVSGKCCLYTGPVAYD